MIRFTATIKRFEQQGEKTGWTYIEVPKVLAEKLSPGNKKAFRVKGTLDHHSFSMVSLLPMGQGDFIMALNAGMRKLIKKRPGDNVQVEMAFDNGELAPPAAFLECLQDEPEALAAFESLTKGHQHYFTNWINSAKTENTRAKRIAASLDALSRNWTFSQMIRAARRHKMGS